MVWNKGINQEVKHCIQCGELFYKNGKNRYTKERWEKRMFCSTDCCNAYGKPNSGVKIKCVICGKDGKRKPSKAGIYCSHKCYWIGKKGQPSPFKGIKTNIKQSKETIEKRRKKMIGRVVPKWVGEKISKSKIGKPRPSVSGEKHWAWNGGVEVGRNRDMKRIEYKEWRRKVFERDDFSCQDCGTKNTYLHADHIIEWNKNIDLRYNIDNGVTLCYYCHYKKTFPNKEFILFNAIKWGVPKQHQKKLLIL